MNQTYYHLVLLGIVFQKCGLHRFHREMELPLYPGEVAILIQQAAGEKQIRTIRFVLTFELRQRVGLSLIHTSSFSEGRSATEILGCFAELKSHDGQLWRPYPWLVRS